MCCIRIQSGSLAMCGEAEARIASDWVGKNSRNQFEQSWKEKIQF